MSGTVKCTKPTRMGEAAATIIIKEAVEGAVATKEEEAVVATKEAMEEAEDMEEAVAIKGEAEATTSPITSVTITGIKMGGIITTTIKVEATITITGNKKGVTAKTGPARNNAMEIRIRTTTLVQDARRPHLLGAMFEPREGDGATETTSLRAPMNQAAIWGETTWSSNWE